MSYETAATSPNQNARPRGVTPKNITIHHWGADGQSFDGVVRYLCRPNGTSSAHYVVEDGRVACIVDPDARAWHAGSAYGNDVSIGIECRPEATDGDYATVAQLVRELRAAYGDLPLVPHRHWKATACPGRWDLARLDRLAREATSPTPTPTPPQEEDDMFTDEDRARAKRIETQLANTKAGLWTGGSATIDGVVQTFKYGALPVVTHNQRLIAGLYGRLAGLEDAIKQLAENGGGAIDLDAVATAARRGAGEALDGATFVLDTETTQETP